MSLEGSVTHWIEDIKEGKSAAARAVWERYFEKLVRLARQKLYGVPCQMADEEDVAISALDSFYRAAQQGRFPDLSDRDSLWRLLLRMTARKTVDRRRYETRQRRGGGRVCNEAALAAPGISDYEETLAQVIGDSPTPELAAMMAEECRRLLEQLDEADLQALVTAKMEGFTNKQIAEQLHCSVRTVERRLRLIRRKWVEESTE
jgi:RNA polymerase sigma factor (sigma-70 family)